jgi:hypothetical protein
MGAVIIFWNGVPLYRQTIADPASHQARLETLIWSLAAIALIQTGYWIYYRLRPPPPKFTNALIGHILSFLARMAFVFAASVFWFRVYNPKAGIPHSGLPVRRDACGPVFFVLLRTGN